MATQDVSRDVQFGKGVYASTNRYTQPQGTIPRVSNLIGIQRDALRTIDGSLIVSSLNGAGATTGQSPFRSIARFNQTGVSSVLLALQVGGSTLLIDITGSSYTGNLASFATTYALPGMVQIGDQVAIALGTSFAPQLWNGAAATPITNTWTGATQLPKWIASQPAQANLTYVIPTPANGHVYVCTQDGMTGTVQPTFPTANGGIVVDNTTIWKESGPDTPAAPPGAAFFFFHLGYLWAWGTSATYTASGIDGPDALRQSDLLVPTSWNPLNMSFVGKGDGTTPQGGAVFTLGESGIAATAQLVLFKDASTYVVNGAFPLVTIQQAPTGVGCVAPKTIQFLKDVGVMRLSYQGVAVFDGQTDSTAQFTDPIRPYLFGGASDITPVNWAMISQAHATQTINPPGYLLFVPINSAITRAFFYDIVQKAWWVMDLPWPVTASYFDFQSGAQARTLTAGASDGTIRRVFAGDADWDGTAIAWSFRTPEQGSPTEPIFLRRINLNGRKFTNNACSLTSSGFNYIDRNGTVATRSLPVFSSGVLGSIGIRSTVLSGNIDITGSGPAVLEGIGIQVTPKPASRIGPPGSVAPANTSGMAVAYSAQGIVTVGAFAVTAAVTLSPAASSSAYSMAGAPNWNTDFWISDKTTVGFNVNFNTPAPGDGSGTFEWQVQL